MSKMASSAASSSTTTLTLSPFGAIVRSAVVRLEGSNCAGLSLVTVPLR